MPNQANTEIFRTESRRKCCATSIGRNLSIGKCLRGAERTTIMGLRLIADGCFWISWRMCLCECEQNKQNNYDKNTKKYENITTKQINTFL